MQNVKDKKQNPNFSVTGAHHQNVVSKQAIKNISHWDYSIILDAIIMWPKTANDELCSFALEHSDFLWNHLTRSNSWLYPLDIFSSNRIFSYDHLWWLCFFGCPYYVLDQMLQDRKKLPNWIPCFLRGQYLGLLPSHSSKKFHFIDLTTGFSGPRTMWSMTINLHPSQIMPHMAYLLIIPSMPLFGRNWSAAALNLTSIRRILIKPTNIITCLSFMPFVSPPLRSSVPFLQ